jgi:hypothetical protein
MRLSSLTCLLCLFAAACGGNVVVGQSSASGSGGQGVGGSGVGATTGSGNGSANGGAGTTSTVGPTSTATGAGGGGVPACASLGYVAVGPAVSCSTEGEQCTMPGTCCGVPLVCQNGQWVMTPLTCQQPCETCGDGLGCSPGAICVEDDIKSIQTVFRCADNSCAPSGTPDCNCAGALCTNEFLMCVGASGPGRLVCTDGTK